MKKKVLIFAPFYTPSIKGGGPIVSTKNIVENLSDRIDFYILTSDRDLGDNNPFEDIRYNRWNKVGNAHVQYIDRDLITIRKLVKIMKSVKFSSFYLNSFFDYHFSILPILAKKLNKNIKGSIVLAPRGEFSPGALQLKSLKKRIYIGFFKLFCLNKNIEWHATGETEKEYIQNIFGEKSSVQVASNLTANYSKLSYSKDLKKEPGSAKFIFISRIHPKKNLLKALSFLGDVKGKVVFSIYGPVEDSDYWDSCQKVVKELPGNVQVEYEGILEHDDILKKINEYHFFLFPTLGENFGHVISEALIGGCPVIVSDQTPWIDLEMKEVGWDIPLKDSEKYIDIIQKCINMDSEEYGKMSKNAFEFGKEKSTNQNSIDSTYKLFDRN